jgi:hypothetical protein
MGAADAWRLGLGGEIVGCYRSLADVQAAAVGGSAAKGQADDYSDIDTAIYWAAALDPSVLESPLVAGPGVERFTFMEAIPGRVWLEQYWLGTAKVDIAHMPWDWVDEEIAAVVEHRDTSAERQDLLEGMLTARTAYGEEHLEPRLARARAYPPELATKMAREHLFFYPPWVLERHGLARGDLFHYHDTLNRMLKNVMGALAAVNRRYMATTKLKRIESMLSEWPLVPTGAAGFLRDVLEARDVGRSITALVEGTFDLVDEHVDGADTGPWRAIFAMPMPPSPARPDVTISPRRG